MTEQCKSCRYTLSGLNRITAPPTTTSTSHFIIQQRYMYKKLTGMGCDALFKYIQHIVGLTSDNTVERNNVRSCQCIGLNGPYK